MGKEESMPDGRPLRLRDTRSQGLAVAFDAPESSCLTYERQLLNQVLEYTSQRLSLNLKAFSQSGLLSKEVVFDIIDDLTFNALTFQIEGRDTILFCSTLPLTLFILFCRVLSSRDALP